MEIALRPEHEQMLEEQIASGRFSSVGEAVAAALELLQRREKLTLEEERKLVQVGIDQLERGEYREVSTPRQMDVFIEEIRQKSAPRGRKGADS